MARKTLPTTASVDDYIDALGDERMRRDCRTLLTLMSEATQRVAVMWGDAIIGFGETDYSYPGTPHRSTRWFEAGFSPRKAALTVYLLGGFDREVARTQGLRASGGGCLYIKRLERVDHTSLRQMIEQSVEKLRTGRS